MAHRPLDRALMEEALLRLDERLSSSARLIIGGGGAMVLAYDYPLATQDIDAFAAQGGMTVPELDAAAKEVAAELDIEPDWLNPHFQTFTAVLPADYASRLVPLLRGKHISVDALGPEDLMIMKCFAGRDKDLPHMRALIKREGFDVDVVDRRLSELAEKRYRGAEKAADCFDDLRDEVGV